MQRSAFGIRGLARIFKAMDENGNKQLECDDFRWGLMDYGVSVTKEEASEILNHFDKNGDGKVDLLCMLLYGDGMLPYRLGFWRNSLDIVCWFA